MLDSCPNPACSEHNHHHANNAPPRERWFTEYGSYPTKNGRTKRYACKTCGTTFSSRTNSIDYYTKKSVSYKELQKEVVTSTSIRAIARKMNMSPGTIQNRISRLARQCIGVLDEILQHVSLQEYLAMDGFESFVLSQYHPNNINLGCGSASQYVYGYSYTQQNRKGCMTEVQKIRAEILHDSSIASLDYQMEQFRLLNIQMEPLISRSNTPIIVSTDKNLAYVEPIREMGAQVAHETVSSRATRDVNNPLFSVNYIDREMRKDLSEHARETLTHGKNVNNQLERLVIYLYDHNLHKTFRINSPVAQKHITHADMAGIPRKVVRHAKKGIYTHRKLYSQVSSYLSWVNRLLWLRLFRTPEEQEGHYHYVPKFVQM